MVDGEWKLELETFLKASAYILGASGSSIMYKVVLEDGTTLVVRRIGESGMEKFKDFYNQVKIIAKLVHPNLIKIREFYWVTEEKLVISYFVPNGSLADARYRLLSLFLNFAGLILNLLLEFCGFDLES
ncbi:putative LRR receptor-like serine/threonine-protein kinase [Capsicum baccatum]|uniref:LRR receptor-like serine/threonine-protein kinase n=1 Tax=Capsicum baccatum TaxID=33114 RepID=A0A2G2VGU8_CAPBA|nr:putative LRR receptor-like serine/threonine-protein kinase [Capsicum baccatum]